MKGNYDRAIADLTRAIELTPDYALAYELRGKAYQKKGDLDRAKPDLAKAKQLKKR